MRGFPGLLLILLLSSSLCYGIAKTVEVVGFGECADCKENNIKTSQALSGTMNYFAYDFMHFFHCMFVSWDNTYNVFHIINSVGKHISTQTIKQPKYAVLVPTLINT